MASEEQEGAIWEEVVPMTPRRRRMPEGAVSLSKDRRRIVFSKDMERKYRLDEVKGMRVRVNPKLRTLGLLFLREGESAPYRVSRNGKSGSRSVACFRAIKKINPRPKPGYYDSKMWAIDFLVVDFDAFVGEHGP